MAYNSLIHVLLVDDHAIVREGLIAVLAEQVEIQVVGEAANGREALRLVRKTKPDVVLLDIRMPDLDGFETLERLQASHAKMNVIMLSATAMPHEVAKARKLGAQGLISKDAECAEICRIIAKVHRGGRHWPAVAARRTTVGRNLSPREIQVLRSARRGLSNAGIGRTLKIAKDTVDSHVKNLIKKLGASDRAAAVARGFETGLLP